MDFLRSFDFSRPFVETRYCAYCNLSWEVKITGLNEPVQFKVLKDRIKYDALDNAFPVISVEGRKIKHRRTGSDRSFRKHKDC